MNDGTSGEPVVESDHESDHEGDHPEEELSAPSGRRERPRVRDALRRPLSPVACWTALLFFWGSLLPTLLPRSALVQGIITAVSVGIGLILGTALATGGRAAFRAAGRTPPEPLGTRRWQVFAVVAVVVGLLGAVAWVAWQNDQRALVDMEDVGASAAVTLLVVAAPVTLLLVVLGRLVAFPVRIFDHVLTSLMPRWVAHVCAAAFVIALGVTLTRDVVVDPLMEFANERFGALDDGTEDGVEPPTSALQSGGPNSLVAWEDLGLQGRTFAGSATSPEELEAFAGPDVTVEEPIRAYVGLQSADDATAQAALAVEELERTGAFDREILAVVTVTGTGWVNPDAATALEQIYAGDTAMVAMQYSYLPSWISFLVDRDKAAENGRALLDAVHERWSALPAAERPRLVVYGESLGSLGSESAFAEGSLDDSVDAATDEVDGVLWIGPTFANPIWHQLIDARNPGDPTWDPSVADLPQIEVLGHPDDDPVGGPAPTPTPVVYLSHPSDPVTWAAVDTLWRPPAWMQDPVGYDLPTNSRWLPGVTFVQNVFDLMAGFSAPPGHGHDYQPSIADGWAATAAPDGWSAADTERLQALIDSR